MVQRIFVPGSEWVYLKIYTGQKTVETLLARDIPVLIRKMKKNDWIKKWFFIRYGDPDFHLRIRFLVQEEQFTGPILSLFYKQLNYYVKHNLIWKIQLDTYKREFERYGENLIEEAESFFHRDSECVLLLIKGLSISRNENYRWMIALKMIDSLLSDFSFDLNSKQRLMELLCNSFKTEFGFNRYNSKQFNVKFRANKQIVESVLNNNFSDNSFIKLYSPIQKRSKELKLPVDSFRLKMKKKRGNLFLENLFFSYIHMMLNRLFVSHNREHELILYDFLKRYYTSEVVKNKYQLLH